jgi:general secretion pathway protein G
MKKPVLSLARPRRARRGLTLIEILVVVTILGILSAIIGLNMLGAMNNAQIQTNEVQLGSLKDALLAYRMRMGRYPTNAEGLEALVKPARGKAVMEELPLDPWGSAYLYRSPSNNGAEVEVRSKGPDLVAETEDDQWLPRPKVAP